MEKSDILALLRAREPELRAAGVASLSLVGSAARGDHDQDSDIDVVVRLSDEPSGGFAYFGRLDELRRKLAEILGRRVDVIAEPVRKDRLREEIERDRVFAF